jgi:hypothetical protein
MRKPSPRNVLVNTHFEADIFVIENNTLGPRTYKKYSYNIDFVLPAQYSFAMIQGLCKDVC